ncbi:hypothetical protein FDUTEX481_08693 [Tolypothrix sp. PCC 7601]|nr:hypothetical protein FDUTEX481_08693 [Tolypothrix sp. PCC 7601]
MNKLDFIQLNNAHIYTDKTISIQSANAIAKFGFGYMKNP